MRGVAPLLLGLAALLAAAAAQVPPAMLLFHFSSTARLWCTTVTRYA
jgi:hypothetical protein